jgi:hypothetical protein
MPRPFEHILMEMRNGRVAEQLTDAWAELIADVHHTGKPGSMTVVFSVKPSGENGMEIGAKVATKPPKPETGASFFYIDLEGNLTRTDTRQRDMFETVAGSVSDRAKVQHSSNS